MGFDSNLPPAQFTKPAGGYLAGAGSGRLLGLLLDSIPRAAKPWDVSPTPPLSPQEIEWVSRELDRRAEAERKRSTD